MLLAKSSQNVSNRIKTDCNKRLLGRRDACAYRESRLWLDTVAKVHPQRGTRSNFASSNERARELRPIRRTERVCMPCQAMSIGTAGVGVVLRRLLRSGCAPLVSMVKTADLRYRNDPSEFPWLHRPRFRRVLAQREVRPGLVIIHEE